MISATVLVNLFLASATLAAHSSGSLKGHTAARHLNTVQYLETPVNDVRDFIPQLGLWGGAIYRAAAPGTISFISGIFTVPTISSTGTGTGDGSAGAWIGIDGIICRATSIGIGVNANFNSSGKNVSYSAFFHSGYNYQTLSGISFKPGDNVLLIVSVSPTNSSHTRVTIENLTTLEIVTQETLSSDRLCQQEASWIVKPATADKLANFDTIVLSNAVARTTDGHYIYPSDASIMNLQDNGAILTNTSAHSSNVTIHFLGYPPSR